MRSTELPEVAARLATAALLGLIWLYRMLASPLLGANCRFEPSCSAYAADAVRQHGPMAGVLLAVRRILRCHPWGGAGADPVPQPPGHRPACRHG